jgi:hypothetical protein
MATFTVSLPDDVVGRLKDKLAPHGYTIEGFASDSLRGFADAGELIAPDLEAKLIQALDTPLLDAGQIDWEAKVRRVRTNAE